MHILLSLEPKAHWNQSKLHLHSLSWFCFEWYIQHNPLTFVFHFIPRCKKHGVPIEKIYNKTQRDKFRWAIDMADEDYEF